MTKVKRKLATILATDCVGFSKHMETDEESTLASLNACRTIIDSHINDHGGRIFHTAGDSVIAEFDSPVECVNAALKFQDALYARNQEDEVHPALQWRVGVHVDDIIIEGDNVYGSGVNIAARLESHCEPGEILVSRVVREQVAKRVSFSIDSAGSRSLKNIAEDFEVFSVATSFSQAANKAAPTVQPTVVSSVSGSDQRKPKLAILPFNNASRDDDSGFLIDGIVEDLITEFSMMREFEILSRATVAEFKVGEDDALTFGQEFGVNFLVGGGIRSSGNRIRLSIELTDASNGSVVWSNKYDRVLDDIFEIQDEIVRTITIQLLGEIEITSLQRSKRKPTENFSSYELLLRGKEQHHVFSKEANARALAFFDKAIELDSGNAQAHAWKTCTLAQGMARGYIEGDPEPVQKAALDHLSMAHDLNENDFEVHRMLANVYLSNHDYAKAEEHGRKAFQLNPNDPRVLSDAGTILVRVGHDAEGLEMLHKALLLDPVPMGQSNSDNRYRDIVLGMYCAGDRQGCVDNAREVRNHDARSWLFLMCSLDALGEDISGTREFRAYRDNFAALDWASTIERFHLPSDEQNEALEKFVTELFA